MWRMDCPELHLLCAWLALAFHSTIPKLRNNGILRRERSMVCISLALDGGYLRPLVITYQKDIGFYWCSFRWDPLETFWYIKYEKDGGSQYCVVLSSFF